MKKITLIGSLFISLFSHSQTFTDNFDSYTAGLNLCPQSSGAWTTWSNAPGGTEDVLVSSADAVSGANSLHFVSTTSSGGPTDLIRNFGVINTGEFSLSFNMKVGSGKAAYFNLQKTAVVGTTYALDANFADNGTLLFSQHPDFTANYPQGTWFNFRLDINFNTNKWEVFFDNVSQGYFSNIENQIASIDIFPVDQDTPYSADYFIDDFSTTIIPYTLPSLNAAVTNGSFSGASIAGNSVPVSFKIRNLGSTTITSFDIVTNYNGITENKTFTGLTLASLVEQSFNMTNNIVLASGSNPLTITVSNVNTLGTDGDANDNVATLLISPITPATGKIVVSEEGTGTWCQWCVRGSVYMDLMSDKYGDYWAGIAVHNADPMTVSIYDAGIGNLISGFPTALVDRGSDIDPSEMEPSILTRLQVAPKAIMTNGATWDAGTRTLKVSVSADFQASATNSYKIACVLTEDEVTGTSSGYNQSNAYAGGNNGVMGGYELLPSSVPASQMVYNHVARTIAPSFAGTNACLPSVINSGEIHILEFSFVLPTTWDENEIEIVSLLIAPDGKIDNAGKATIPEAVTNGFVVGCNAGISEVELSQMDDVFQMYPNPASSTTTITLHLKEESSVKLKVIDMSGKEVASRNYGSLNGSSSINMNTNNFQSGVYLVEMTINNQKMTKRLIIK